MDYTYRKQHIISCFDDITIICDDVITSNMAAYCDITHTTTQSDDVTTNSRMSMFSTEFTYKSVTFAMSMICYVYSDV